MTIKTVIVPEIIHCSSS